MTAALLTQTQLMDRLRSEGLPLGHADPRTTLIYQEVSREEQAKRQTALWG